MNGGAITADETLVTGSTDASIRVWDFSRAANFGILEGYNKTVAGLAVHPSQAIVASASYATTVRD